MFYCVVGVGSAPPHPPAFKGQIYWKPLKMGLFVLETALKGTGGRNACLCHLSRSPAAIILRNIAPHTVVDSKGGETSKPMGGQPWPNLLLRWKASPVNPLDRSSG